MRRIALLAWLVGLVACEPDLGVITCPDGTVCAADLACPLEPGGPCMAEGCRGKAPGDDCHPTIGGGGSCNAEGVCVPFSCGDGQVEAPEVCDTVAPSTCGELGFDYGRTACAADCSGVVTTCDFIDDRDLGLDLEQVQVNAVGIEGQVVWAAGANGIYRNAGQWERVLDGTWYSLRVVGPDDVWALSFASAAHWDGATWTVEPWSYGSWGAVEVIDGQLVVGTFSGTIVTRIGGAWVPETIDGQGLVHAIAKVGGDEVVALGFFGGDPLAGSFYSFTRLYKRDAAGWVEVPFIGDLSTVDAIAGTTLDDFIVSGRYYPPAASSTTQFRTRRITTSGGTHTVTSIPGSGFIVPVDRGWLILPISPYGMDAADPEVVGTFYREGVARRVSIPGRARLVAADGQRVIVAVGNRVRELGGSLHAPALAIQSAQNPVFTSINVQDLAASASGDVFALDARGVVWRMVNAASAVPQAMELVRNLTNSSGVWGTGSQYVTISSDQFTWRDGATVTSSQPITDPTSRDVAGNANNDVMVVGTGTVPARHFDGTSWTPATAGLPPGAKLRAVAATGDGFVAVGDGGLVAVFASHTWVVRDAGTQANLTVVDAAGATFAAAGAGVVIRCSPAGCVGEALAGTPTGVAFAAADDIIVVAAGKTVHFDGIAWSPVDLHGAAPSRVLSRDNTLWFGEGGAAGRIQQLVRMRSWR